jgi:ATP-dependent DNA ligase
MVCVLARGCQNYFGLTRLLLCYSGEGLLIKNPESQYVLNGRDESWIKLKPGKAC